MSTAISLRFPAGSYHATPWGSHANEAGVEWPPSPWRMLRALVAQWHRKASPERFPDTALETLIERLSESDPLFRLPAAVASHTRHYMPVREGRSDRPVLIFDAFARIDPADEMVIAWLDVGLGARERELLSALLHGMAYLGRAESWVEARLLDACDGEFNAGPAGSTAASEIPGRVPVRLIAPITAAEYAEWRGRTVGELGLDARRLTRTQKQQLATLPPRLLDALRLDTGDLRDAGWNLPPGGRMVTYQRPRLDAPAHVRRARRADVPRRMTTVRLALAGKPLPRIEHAVRIGELVRAAAIKAADRTAGPEHIPPEISGHGETQELNHRHAFYLPEDANDDGRIDHVLIHAPGGLSPAAVTALASIQRLWTEDGAEWNVVFEGAWPEPDSSRSIHGGRAATWTSLTPYLHPWHAKPGFGVAEQVRRECKRRGLPAPIGVRLLPSVRIRDRERRPVHFHRFRSRRGLRQPDRRGSLVEITFGEVVAGPLALGFGCHYGLGMFVPSGG